MEVRTPMVSSGVAITLTCGSAIARDWLGDYFVDHFAATREWEWRQWLDGVTDWELKRYFEII